MSGIKRGIKKVFRGVKKVVKKIAKPALIIGATFLTAGLATGGFTGFTNLMAAASKGGAKTIGSFFSAVGKTIGAGAQAIGGSLGIGSGVSPGLAGQMGIAPQTTLFSGTAAQALGFEGPAASVISGPSTQSLASLGGSAASGYSSASAIPGLSPLSNAAFAEVTKQAAGGGFLGTITNAFNNMSPIGQMMIGQGIMGGISSYAQGREARRQERREEARGIFGVSMGGEVGATPEEFEEVGRRYAMYNPNLTGDRRRRDEDEEESGGDSYMPRRPLLG